MGLIIRPFFNHLPYLASTTLILSLIVGLGLSVWTLRSVAGNGPLVFEGHPWITVASMDINIRLMVDSLTAIMLVIVTGVSLMVQVYSQGYMRGDPGYIRYFAFMSLFSAAMIGLVISGNIIQLYVMWELVGLGSYLLIGFWNHRPAAVAAAKKAFIVTRIGDFGFLLAILYLFFNRSIFLDHGLNPLDISDIHASIPLIESGVMVAIGVSGLTWLALGIFAGAAGKSAQFPFHVWLPDAMEGPTPVSALIHAATMVAAGVFLVARFFPVFEASDQAMLVVAFVGAFTAFFAATMGIVMNDIKKVLAYSTISQLGYMIAALGIGAYGPAIFHLFTHALFKALLFLGAGSVNHATGTFDMRYMGGLRKVMPVTYVGMLLGGFSLVGIFPFAGFWSKDEILSHAWNNPSLINQAVFWLLITSVAMTAFYTFRMIYMTFHGEFRGGIVAEENQDDKDMPHIMDRKKETHLAESPVLMTGPIILLAVGAVVSGYLANPQFHLLNIPPHWFSEFVVPSLHSKSEIIKLNMELAFITMAVAVSFIVFATLLYVRGNKVPAFVGGKLDPVRRLTAQKYYMDELYEKQVVARGFYRYIGGLLEWVDQQFVDSIVDGFGWISRNVGWLLGRSQTGQVQFYGAGMVLGIVLILSVYLLWG